MTLQPATAAESLTLPRPYVAGINHPKLGSHAVVVDAVAGDGTVTIIDPFEAARETFAPQAWEQAGGGWGIVGGGANGGTEPPSGG